MYNWQVMASAVAGSPIRTSLRRFVASPSVHWGLVLFLLALGLRLAWLSIVSPGPLLDGWFFYYSAESIASGEGFINPFTRAHTASLPPGYAFLLSGLFVTFGADPLVAKVFNVVAGAVTVVLVYALATRLAGQRAGIVAGVVLALFPSQIFFPVMIMTEALFAGLLVGLVLLLVIWLSKGSMKTWQVFVLGLLLGAMSLVRAETILLVPSLIVLWLVLRLRWQAVAQHGLILAVGMAILITPWTIRNYVRFEEFIPIRGGQGAPLRGARIALSMDYDSPRYTIVGGRQEPAPLDQLIADHLRHPWQLADLGARKIADMFGRDYAFAWIDLCNGNPNSPFVQTACSQDQAPLSGNGYEPPGGVAPWAAIGDAYYYAVGLTVLLGVPVLLAKGDRRYLIIAWFIASWCLIHLIYVPQPRYHFPVLPMVSIFAGIVLVEIWDRVKHRLRPPQRKPQLSEAVDAN